MTTEFGSLSRRLLTPAEARLIEEWPSLLGTMALLSRHPRLKFAAVRAKHLDLLRRFDADPLASIQEFLHEVFRLKEQTGDFSNRAGDAVSAAYFLTYLAKNRDLARMHLQVFVPLLRAGLWDDQFRYRLEFIFFEHAWEVVFDVGGIEEPQRDEDFDWPGSLNAWSGEERAALLDYAGLAPLEDPARPSVAPWNKRWMNLGWLWDSGYERDGGATFLSTLLAEARTHTKEEP